MASAQQARRPFARIVPAIPHRLVKPLPSARPITPEESNKGMMARYDNPPEQESQAIREEQPEEQPGSVEPPLTPDSRLSVADKSETDVAILPHSPSYSHHSDLEHPARSQSENADDVDCSTTASPTLQPVMETIPVATSVEPSSPSRTPNKVETPMPSANGHDLQNKHSHRHQLSAGALVFRSANESPASPTTFQENKSYPNEGQHLLSQPSLGFGPPHIAPFYSEHLQHVCEIDASWFYPPYSTRPLDSVPKAGADPEALLLGGPHVSFNGHNSVISPSQSPGKAGAGEQKMNGRNGFEEHALSFQDGVRHLAERLEESPFELAAYLSTQAGSPEFSDFTLQVRLADSIIISIPVHGVVVVRSMVIAESIRRSPASDHSARDTRRLIELYTADSFVTRDSLEEAIKVLYGAPLLLPQTFLYGLGPYLYENDRVSPSSDARRRMQQVLSYVAAARLLQISNMQARGIEIARMLLRWDTIEQVLQYGLQASNASQSRSDKSESDDPFMTALLNYAIDFMASTLPVEFKLYTIAPELHDAPRLPTLIETRTPTHNPRLSKIRFGDAPPEDDLQPNHATRVLSTILLSLPTPLIELLFNHRATANQIGWTGAIKLMRDVINERESRRLKALRGQLKPHPSGSIPSSLLNNLHLEESVEPSPNYPSGYRLATKFFD